MARLPNIIKQSILHDMVYFIYLGVYVLLCLLVIQTDSLLLFYFILFASIVYAMFCKYFT